MKPLLACPSWLHRCIVAVVVAWLAVWLVSVTSAVSPPNPFGLIGTPVTQIIDFPSHLHFAREVWSGRWSAGHVGESAYSPAAHREMMRGWTGEDFREALPFGYSPTMLWLLAPLTLLDDRLGFLAWGLLGLMAVAWMIRPRNDPLLLGVLCFLCPVAVRCVSLGQTGILSTLALLVLYQHTQAGGKGRPLVAVLALWALTAKPPLALMAGAALLALGCWRVVAWSVALTLLTTLLVSPWLGPGWVADYVALIRGYNSEEADPLFAWCLAPDYMTNLRAMLFYGRMSDALACRVCWALWLAGTAALLLVCRRSGPACWIVAIVAMLLFAPHVNQTEDLHLFVAGLAAWSMVEGRDWPPARLWPYAFVLVVLAGGWAPPLGMALACVGKAALLAGTVLLMRTQR